MKVIRFLFGRLHSIKPAINGILFTIKNEKNTWVHILATLVAIVLIFVLNLNYIEILFFVSAIIMVWIAEFFNTAIEYTLDFIHPEKHSNIKIIKDISAAGVLFSAIYALLVAIIITATKISSALQ
jgi:diacylglycerol kinase